MKKLNFTKEEFIEKYNSLTYKELSKELSLNSDQIARIAKELGLSKPKGRRKLIWEFKDEEVCG